MGQFPLPTDKDIGVLILVDTGDYDNPDLSLLYTEESTLKYIPYSYPLVSDSFLLINVDLVGIRTFI